MRDPNSGRRTLANNTQTDAVARCCGHTYYRYGRETWFASAPWSVMMPEHFITCHCGKTLTYLGEQR
jgi:hypothetical protein